MLGGLIEGTWGTWGRTLRSAGETQDFAPCSFAPALDASDCRNVTVRGHKLPETGNTTRYARNKKVSKLLGKGRVCHPLVSILGKPRPSCRRFFGLPLTFRSELNIASKIKAGGTEFEHSFPSWKRTSSDQSPGENGASTVPSNAPIDSAFAGPVFEKRPIKFGTSDGIAEPRERFGMHLWTLFRRSCRCQSFGTVSKKNLRLEETSQSRRFS